MASHKREGEKEEEEEEEDEWSAGGVGDEDHDVPSACARVPHQDRIEPITFASVKYWDDEYGELSMDSEPWEWYESYSRFRRVLLHHLARAVPGTETIDSIDEATMARVRKLRVLIIGCGNSRLGEDLVDLDRFESVTCLDFSAVVIGHMLRKYLLRPQIQYVHGDATDMRSLFSDHSFDVVIDKGTFDALLCHPDVVNKVDALLNEISRVTEKGGLYLCISQSEKRAFYFEDHFGEGVNLQQEKWAKAEDSPIGHLNPVPFFHLYALSLPSC